MATSPGARPAVLARVLAGPHGVDWRNAGLILAGCLARFGARLRG